MRHDEKYIEESIVIPLGIALASTVAFYKYIKSRYVKCREYCKSKNKNNTKREKLEARKCRIECYIRYLQGQKRTLERILRDLDSVDIQTKIGEKAVQLYKIKIKTQIKAIELHLDKYKLDLKAVKRKIDELEGKI